MLLMRISKFIKIVFEFWRFFFVSFFQKPTNIWKEADDSSQSFFVRHHLTSNLP